MNIVDSCGWLEYFADGPNAGYFAPAIEDIKKLLVPSIIFFEVFKRIYQQKGEDLALQAVAVMNKAKIVELNDSGAVFAAKLSVENNLPMADSIIFATAQMYKAVIWTQDSDFEGLAGVKYIKAKK
ncbi:MAG: type II toxin-antitoxin system VapC family toxin [Elusimicrobia bacterium]|nr:type II toxin-antitoxin system VapC family toxin [Elusimicrobiota bacterium]